MQRNQERRDEHEKRVPIRAAVELAESSDDAFGADAVNLSRGGMSLRSQCLPDLGARLWCRFEHAPSGSVIEAEGEVVWAQLEGEASGEIGLAFTNLDPETEMLIEQIIAQHGSPTAAGVQLDVSEQDRAAAQLDASAAIEQEREERDDCEEPRGRASEPPRISLPPISGARVANLSLEGIDEPLSANVAELSLDYAVFEQVLPLLKLGRSVSADAPELLGRRGSIAGVELRMMGHVPTLAVIVEFSEGAARRHDGYGEASLSSTDHPAVDEQALCHDTEPDLDAPLASDQTAEPAQAQRVTAAEFSKSPALTKPKTQPSQLALDVAPAPAPRMATRAVEKPSEEPMPPALASSSGAELRSSARSAVTGEVAGEVAAGPVARSSRLDPTQVVELPGEQDDDDGTMSDPFAPAPAAWEPFALAAMRALHALVRGLKAVGTASVRMLGSTGVAALPHVRLLMVRARAVLGQASIVVGPKLGAARRLAAAQLGRKRRRTTGGSGAAVRERESNDSGSLVRTIGIGAFATLIAGLGVYAMLPSGEPELELHRAIAAPQGEAGLSGAEAALAADDPGAEAAQPAAEPELPMPSAATVPAGSAYAVDVREQARTKPAAAAAPAAPKAAGPAPQAVATAAKPAPRSMRFGASSAPSRAQTFALRMSKPIASISGSADAGGFTVVVMGSLSLDRAGPISASHRGVARAMVLNKGDRSELTIRFADGKRPTYQVRADGQTLYVVIEEV